MESGTAVCMETLAVAQERDRARDLDATAAVLLAELDHGPAALPRTL